MNLVSSSYLGVKLQTLIIMAIVITSVALT